MKNEFLLPELIKQMIADYQKAPKGSQQKFSLESRLIAIYKEIGKVVDLTEEEKLFK